MSTIGPLPESLKWVHNYFFAVDNEKSIKTDREKYRVLLKEFLFNNFDIDDRGNYYWEFDSPIKALDGIEYRGIMAQRRVSEYTDEEKLIKLLDAKGLTERCTQHIPQLDLDEVFACNQEGLITDEEIESVLEYDETYSIVRVK